MKLQVDGIEYSNFLDAKTILYLDALSSKFEFTATAQDAVPLPFKGGEDCVVTANDVKILTGFIEIVNVDGSSNDHTIKVSGRDKCCDIGDSAINVLSDIRAPISLRRIIEKIIKHIGANIKVIDEATPALFNKAEDLTAPEPGQNVWQFIEGYARKRNVLVTSNGDGDVVIARSSGEEIDASIHHRVNDDTNNVLSYAVTYDSTGRFNKYFTVAQLNPLLAQIQQIKFGTIVNQSGESGDDAIRAGRQFVFTSENPASNSQLTDRAVWEANIRKARGRTYSATVHGFVNQTGDIWRNNTLIKVDDQYAGIDDLMLVNRVAFSLSDDGGRATTLSLVEKDAYTLSINEPVVEKQGFGLSLI